MRRASDETVKHVLSRAPIENILNSYYNDFIEANVSARADAGIKEMVIREALGGCCDWCQKLTGIYEYGNHPKDIFKRHDNCTCIVTFKDEEGYTDVWSKKKFESEREARIAWAEKFESNREFNQKYGSRRKIADDEGEPYSVRADIEDFEYMSKSFRPEFGKSEVVKENFGLPELPEIRTLKLKKVLNSQFEVYADVETSRRSKAVRLVEKSLMAIREEMPKGYKLPKVYVVDFEKYGIENNAIAAYKKDIGTIFINSKYDTAGKIEKFLSEKKGEFASTDILSPYRHELGHHIYRESIQRIAKEKGLAYNVFDENSEAKQYLDSMIQEYVHRKNNEGIHLGSAISEYALKGYKNYDFSEVVAECFAKRFYSTYAQGLLKLLKE